MSKRTAKEIADEIIQTNKLYSLHRITEQTWMNEIDSLWTEAETNEQVKAVDNAIRESYIKATS